MAVVYMFRSCYRLFARKMLARAIVRLWDVIHRAARLKSQHLLAVAAPAAPIAPKSCNSGESDYDERPLSLFPAVASIFARRHAHEPTSSSCSSPGPIHGGFATALSNVSELTMQIS